MQMVEEEEEEEVLIDRRRYITEPVFIERSDYQDTCCTRYL